jgi:hypothetical protein
MKIQSNYDIRRANKQLAAARIKPFQKLGLPRNLVEKIREEMENCFAQGVLYERNGKHLFPY